MNIAKCRVGLVVLLPFLWPSVAQSADPPAENLILWLRADSGVETSGAEVIAWRDQSGLGHDAVPFGSGERPVLDTQGVRGRQSLLFDGHDDSLFDESYPTTYFLE